MAKEKKGEYVMIQSTVNITVSAGLQCQDNTVKDSDIPNRLKVNPTWTKCMIDIKVGQNWYPSEIVEWPAVQALQKDGILTIGSYSDIPNNSTDKDEFIRNFEDMKSDSDDVPMAKIKKIKSLNDISGDNK